MSQAPEKPTIVVTKVHVRPECTNDFVDWQAKLNASIVSFPGFVSLEISCPQSVLQEWMIVQRFTNSENFSTWRLSKEHTELMKALKHFLVDSPNALQETESGEAHLQGRVTEVFVTQVSPDMENAYREWIAKIHQVEAKFPGFQGVYVQSPPLGKGNWITLLQFDTPENLDRWLSSKEREDVLHESKPLIASLESHRVISPYAGWFASIAKDGKLPPIWKQTMLVLLVLFPIVMLELKYLSLLTASLNSSLATFIGNAISVSLIAWPFMPIAIWFLGWWLAPKNNYSQRITLLGTGVLLVLYAIEIIIFWKLI